MLRDASAVVTTTSRVVLGDHVLDIARGELLDSQGHPAELRAQALKVLLVLGERAGEVVGKEELMRRVWGDVVVTEDSLVQAVGDIRRALGTAGQQALRTVPRRGYRLLPSPPAGGAQDVQGRGPGSPDPRPRPRHRAAAAWFAAVVALLLTLVLASLASRDDRPTHRSLAILPFESDDPTADDWFADAITSDLNAMVASWRAGLHVIGRGTMQGFKGKGADPRTVARELKVAHVLSGRVRREGDRLRIAVELVDAANGGVVWARTIDIDRAELPGSVGDIAGGIAKALTIDLGNIVPSHAGRLNAAQADADDLAMHGLSVLLKSLGPENVEQARRLFEQAVARDPRSIRGLAGVSLANSMSVPFGWSRNAAASMQRSQEALDRLEAIDPTAQLTLLARASHRLSSADWRGQLAVADELVRHFPNDPSSYHHRCSSLLRLARFDEAIAACDRAIRISPQESRTPIWHGLAGMNEFMRGRYAAAAERARIAVAGAPKVPFFVLLLAASLAHDGQGDEARRLVEDFSARFPEFDAARVATVWLATNADPRFVAGRDLIVATARGLGWR